MRLGGGFIGLFQVISYSDGHTSTAGRAIFSSMSKNTNPDTRMEKRNALLAALAKARGEMNPSNENSDDPDNENNSYYTLTKEEVEALVSGNMEKIESWVSNLDRRHATWLLRWLIKENAEYFPGEN